MTCSSESNEESLLLNILQILNVLCFEIDIQTDRQKDRTKWQLAFSLN